MSSSSVCLVWGRSWQESAANIGCSAGLDFLLHQPPARRFHFTLSLNSVLIKPTPKSKTAALMTFSETGNNWSQFLLLMPWTKSASLSLRAKMTWRFVCFFIPGKYIKDDMIHTSYNCVENCETDLFSCFSLRVISNVPSIFSCV